MSRGYRSRFQDFINVWTMPANMLKNKVIHSHCRFCKLRMMYMFKTFVSLVSGHASYFPECCVDVVFYVCDNEKVIINMAGSIL